MKSIFLVLLVAFACYGIWFIATLSNCKKNNVPVKDKLAELWNEPFWIGPEKLEKVREISTSTIGIIILLAYSIYGLVSYGLMTYSYMELNLFTSLSLTLHSRYTLLLLMFFSLFLVKQSLKQRLFVSFIEICFLADIFFVEKSVWFNKSAVYIPIFTLLVVANEIKLEKVFKILFALTTSFYAVVFSLSLLGVIGSGDITTLESRGNDSGWLAKRYALGFCHPNAAGILLAVIVIMWFIIRNNKIKWFDWLIGIAAVAVITVVIDCRGAQLLLLIFMAALIIFKYFPKIYDFKVLKYLSIVSPALFAIISFVCAKTYNGENAIWQKLNAISTGRFGLFKANIDKYMFTFFGQTRVGGESIPIDNAYLQIYLKRGVIVCAIIVVLYCILVKRLWNKKATPELGLVFGYIFYFFVEAHLMNIVLNISLYLLASIILLEPESKQQLFHSETKAVKQLSSIKK